MAALAVLALAGCQAEGGTRASSQPLNKLAGVTMNGSLLEGALANAPLDRETCTQVLTVSQQGQLIIDRSVAGRMVVAENQWTRLPIAARSYIARCAAAAQGTDGQQRPLQIVSDRTGVPMPK